MISKELLKNVLYGENIDNISIISNDITFEYSHYVNGVFQYRRKTDINIYELAHKCKEWALKHHYKVISKPDNVPGLWEAYVNLSLTSKHGEVADTEPEAIFKACQWILTKELA